MSRLGRNYLEAGDYLEKIFPFFGVRFITITDGYDSSCRNLTEEYVLNQDYEKAEELVNGLPSFLCGREFMIAEVLRGDEKLQSYHSIIKMLETQIDVYQKRIEKIQL